MQNQIENKNINIMADFASITKNFLYENLFYLTQKILIKLILNKVFFPFVIF